MISNFKKCLSSCTFTTCVDRIVLSKVIFLEVNGMVLKHLGRCGVTRAMHHEQEVR